MSEPFFFVLGENGFLGRNIVMSLRSQNRNIIGISRDIIKVYTHKEVLSLPFSLDEVKRLTNKFNQNSIVINCVRDNSSTERVEFFDLLKMVAEKSELVLNFSTYIQYYELNHGSQLANYRRNQANQSGFLESACRYNRFIDVALFTVFGQGDSEKSFLVSLLRQARSGVQLELSGLEQLVSYTWIGDVVNLVNLILSELTAAEGRYSFWPEPPMKLSEVVQLLLETINSKNQKLIGVVPYRGHELFTYDASLFPAQIFPGFLWTPFDEGLAHWLPTVQI